MNYKTTLALIVALAVMGGLYLVRQRTETSAPTATTKTPAQGESGTTRQLIDPKPGDAVNVVVKRRGEPDWVFEKDAGAADAANKANWRMTAPFESMVAGYEVDRIGRQLSGLSYDIAYKPGEPGGVTAAQAGLEPPDMTVTFTDAAGLSATIDVGRPASDSETYVRLPGKDAIVVAKANLKNLVKAKAMEYRDLQLWNFPAEKATRVEIVDRGAGGTPINYLFTKDGTKWMLESPVSAKATGKVDEMLRSMNRLRAAKWEDDRRERLAVYGLDPARWTVRVTVEEDALPEAKTDETGEDKEAETPPAKKTSVHELHLSETSPIGDDAKVYIRSGDQAVAGTMLKTAADKFKPVMAEWRDMHVTTANVNEATRIEISSPEGQAVLVKDLGRWKFEGQGGPAEDSAVKNILKSLADMTAVAFTDGETVDPATSGLTKPQAEFRLTVPGLESVERITVGGYSDAATKRLLYVRRNDVASLAKVRATDVTPLLQNPRSYRDRTIVDVPPSRLEKLTLTTQNDYSPTPAPLTVTFERTGEEWNMAAPAAGSVRKDRIDKFAADLGALRAEAIVAEEGSLSAFSLDAPAATIQWTYKPPVEYRIDPAKSPAAGESKEAPPKAEPMEVQPPSQTVELIVSEHDGKHYAKRSDRPAVYQISPDFYKQVLSEFRSPDVLTFDDSKVQRFSIRAGDQTFTFDKKDSRWVYTAEPDLPLDSNKIQNLLLQLKDLKTDRYAGYGVSDLAALGLTSPFREVIVRLDDGTEHVLWVSDRSPSAGIDKGFYAMVKGRSDVFLLSPETVQRFQVSLSDLEKGR